MLIPDIFSPVSPTETLHAGGIHRHLAVFDKGLTMAKATVHFCHPFSAFSCLLYLWRSCTPFLTKRAYGFRMRRRGALQPSRWHGRSATSSWRTCSHSCSRCRQQSRAQLPKSRQMTSLSILPPAQVCMQRASCLFCLCGGQRAWPLISCNHPCPLVKLSGSLLREEVQDARACMRFSQE